MSGPAGGLSVMVGGTHKKTEGNDDFYYPQMIFSLVNNRVTDISLWTD